MAWESAPRTPGCPPDVFPELTELHQVVDSQQELHLLGDGLDSGGAALLIRPGHRLGVLVACIQQRADHDIAQVPAQVGEVPVACTRGNGSSWATGHTWLPQNHRTYNGQVVHIQATLVSLSWTPQISTRTALLHLPRPSGPCKDRAPMRNSALAGSFAQSTPHHRRRQNPDRSECARSEPQGYMPWHCGLGL